MEAHEHACHHHHHEAPAQAAASACCGGASATAAGHAAAAEGCGGVGPCGGTGCGDAHACGGCADAGLQMPVTEETVTLRANDLATLLDLVEAFAGSSYDEDGAYTRAAAAMADQAPALVQGRAKLLETFREIAGRVVQRQEAG